MSRFFTPEEEAELRKNGMQTDGGDTIDYKPVVKLHVPHARATWLLTELSPFYEGMAFGLCDLGEPELGPVFIPELEKAIHETTGEFLVQKDELFVATHTIAVYAEAASFHREIIENKELLDSAEWYYKTRRGLEPN